MLLRIWTEDELVDTPASNMPVEGDLRARWVAGHLVLDSCVAVKPTQWATVLEHVTSRGTVGGLATLGIDGKVPNAQLPTLTAGPHTHPISDITGLQAALDGKAATSHGHAQTDVTGLGTALDGKAAVVHVHTIANITGLQAALDGKVAVGSVWTVVRKTADEARSNSTVLINDAALKVTLAANTRYALRGKMWFETAATPDFKWRHAGPASPTLVRLRRAWILPGGTSEAGLAVDTAYSAADLVLVGTGALGGCIELEGVVRNGSTAGDFRLQWAQNTANASPTTVLAGSYLEYAVV